MFNHVCIAAGEIFFSFLGFVSHSVRRGFGFRDASPKNEIRKVAFLKKIKDNYIKNEVMILCSGRIISFTRRLLTQGECANSLSGLQIYIASETKLFAKSLRSFPSYYICNFYVEFGGLKINPGTTRRPPLVSVQLERWR